MPVKKNKKKKTKSVSDLVQQMKNDVFSTTNISSSIPDIITFCESPEYLDMSNHGIFLYPVQAIMLKVFYRNSPGNGNLKLTDKEIELCKEFELNTVERGDILNKYENNAIFRELILVWGRRSGKDFLSGIVMAYESMRLLECIGGDPYVLYGISPSNPISILTVATSSDQAALAFREVQARIVYSKYFQDKLIGVDGIGVDTINLLTPKDKQNNLLTKYKTKGSIEIKVGHSNSKGLLGKQIFVLLLDEVASYSIGGGTSGEKIHADLIPSLATFGRNQDKLDKNGDKVLDENGEIKQERVLDSKLICISSPLGEEGIFYDLYKKSHLYENRLMCKLPTWKVNPPMTEEFLRKEFDSLSDVNFMMQFGAEFSGTAGETMFVRAKVLECFKAELRNKAMGQVGAVYFAHLDPATTSHNYALIVLHLERYFDKDLKKSDFRVIVDHIKYWHPTTNNPIRITDVDEYVINLKRRFHLGLVTYDIWNSVQSIEKLKKKGIPAKCTHFSSQYKMAIYNQLEVLINTNRVWIPRHKLLQDEMTHIERRYTAKGFQVRPSKDGQIKTDDLVDSLAAACYTAMNAKSHKLPGGRVVSMNSNPSGNSMTWRSMQGVPYGTGTGSQVARQMEQRGSQPNAGQGIPPSIFR